ncbi:DUF2339 domain-containing protein [Aquabacterium sp. A7-Y]|uniref:DUF2339 domain-containing protein n=1 Tax=Aquabacterium sp. A7-Y TaxID=1349605 RepID=UPI0039FBB621
MKFLCALIGGFLGWGIGDLLGAIVGVALGPILVAMLQKQGDPEPAAPGAARPGLEARLQALEREVAALRSEVRRLGGEAAAEAATPTSAQGRVADPPAPLATPPAGPVRAPEPVGPRLSEAAAAAALAGRPASADSDRTTGPAVPPALPPAPAVPATAEPAPAERRPLPRPAAVPQEPARPPAAPAVPLRDRLPPGLSRWIFGGNTIVKVGVLILFLGLAFLLRYAAERVTLPVELRYAGVALVGAVLLGLGWRLRERSDAAGGHGYGVILQGAGIGVFYLTALTALKLHPQLLPATAAFAFMAGVSVLGSVLAVRQNALWLALVSVAEGFAAPVLVSTGGGNHVALFSYLAILDLGIFGMAWFRAWRPLNLVGLTGTLTLAGAWAERHYRDELYASTQAFLLLFFLLFTAIGVLFARRALAEGDDAAEAGLPLSARAGRALSQVGRVDSALVFGVPLASFGLQYGLVSGHEWGPAWAAFGYATFYLLLGGVLLRGGHLRYSLLGEAYAIVGVIFATLSIPLALEGAWTGATWAVEAAGMYWLGARQRRPYARGFGLLVLGAALLRLLASLGLDLGPGTPLLTGSRLGVVLCGAGALAVWAVGRRLPADTRPAWEQHALAWLPWSIAAAVAAWVWMLLVPLWASVVCAWLALACFTAPGRRAGRDAGTDRLGAARPGPGGAGCHPAWRCPQRDAERWLGGPGRGAADRLAAAAECGAVGPPAAAGRGPGPRRLDAGRQPGPGRRAGGAGLEPAVRDAGRPGGAGLALAGAGRALGRPEAGPSGAGARRDGPAGRRGGRPAVVRRAALERHRPERPLGAAGADADRPAGRRPGAPPDTPAARAGEWCRAPVGRGRLVAGLVEPAAAAGRLATAAAARRTGRRPGRMGRLGAAELDRGGAARPLAPLAGAGPGERADAAGLGAVRADRPGHRRAAALGPLGLGGVAAGAGLAPPAAAPAARLVEPAGAAMAAPARLLAVPAAGRA